MSNKTNEQIVRTKPSVEPGPRPIPQPRKPTPIPDRKPLKQGQQIITEGNEK